MYSLIRLLALSLIGSLLAACGGSGSSDPQGTGSVAILLGDGPLDDVIEVNIDIDRVVLLGADGQIVLTEDATPEPVNLLELRNVTELLLDVDDVPAGRYSKIRMYIDSLQIVRDDLMAGRIEEDAQLPANGKIDLNPQGPFEISPGEDLVIQIDLDVGRSVHTVLTGNSSLRFRPVVFIEVLDQRANLRLTHLFGVMDNVAASAFDLCESVSPAPTDCTTVNVRDNALVLPPAGVDPYDPMDGEPAHAFGHFVVGASGGISFRALAVVYGAEDTVGRIDGEVLAGDDSIIDTIGGRAVEPVPGALLLDGLGNPIDGAEDGDFAESWAQVDPAVVDLPAPFPSFLTQVGPALDEEVVEGVLVGIDGNTLTVRTDDLNEVCVAHNNATQIQQVDGFSSDAETGIISLGELSDLPGEPEISAFGTFDGGTPDCLVASVIVVET
ncbi:MAG: DUF4382 domain-containing protein [Pseudomonadales bacterium]